MNELQNKAPSPQEPPSTTPEKVLQKRVQQAQARQESFAFLLKLACIALVLWLVFSFVFGVGIVHGEDMYPRMRDGDLYVYYRLEESQVVGDIFTFRVGGSRYVGRIVAAESDTVDMSEGGQLLVNGNVQSEEIFFATTKDDKLQEFPFLVPEDSVFILCDNRTVAADSRDFGAIPVKDLDGKVISLLRRRGL